jgi:hypothetical protein
MDAPTAHRQIGTHEDVLIFERDLVELAARLGCPHPEVRGYRDKAVSTFWNCTRKPSKEKVFTCYLAVARLGLF